MKLMLLPGCCINILIILILTVRFAYMICFSYNVCNCHTINKGNLFTYLLINALWLVGCTSLTCTCCVSLEYIRALLTLLAMSIVLSFVLPTSCDTYYVLCFRLRL